MPRAAAVLLALTGLLAAHPLAAAQASYGQYLVVIDDSGSMDRNDPRRLAVLASFALAAALEDGDQVMLVGLNELASGEGSGARFVSPRELLPDREGPEGVRLLSAERATRLGTHRGETPCRAAMERARAILESVASAGAPQTLLLLTDGACNGGAVEPAERWLAGLRAHREGRFRFVLLMRSGPERVDPALEAYGRRTGWQGDSRVSFDARALLRAFADVLSFSRGLRYDESGRVGLERTFAGARSVRVLAIRDRGEGPITLERIDRVGAGAPLERGPTFAAADHGWSFRATTVSPRAEPFAVRSATSGVDVLVIPVYGRLRVEALVAPCGEPPPAPWSAEVPVRAGQPACAFARLIGDTGETIVPGGSFEFGIAICEQPSCARASPMQPGRDGIFHAQLGAAIESGRHELTFRASGGALAVPVDVTRGFAAMSFGVRRVALASDPQAAITSIDLGELPRAVSEDLVLRYSGAFPAGARGRARCEIEGSDALRACVRCEVPNGEDVPLQDEVEIRATVSGRPFCALISGGDGEPRPVRMRLWLEPRDSGAEMTGHALPISATLRYLRAEPIALRVVAGEASEQRVRVPGPRAQTEIRARVEGVDEGARVEPTPPRLEVHAGADGAIELSLRASAGDCCSAGRREGMLHLEAEGSALDVPLTLEVQPPTFWTCPGRQIAMAFAAPLTLALLCFVVHGFVAPARFDPGALLLSASSLDELISLREGDDGFRWLRRFPQAKRGFRRPAAIWLGGPRAPLPSLRRLPPDGRIEAQAGGGATLVITGPGIQRWNEVEGRFVELEPGTYPVPNRVRIQRGEELFLEFRR